MVRLREQLFSSYLDGSAFDQVHRRPRLANYLHSPLHTQSFYHPNVSTDARTSQEASLLSFAYAFVWAARQVVRFLVVLERPQEENLLSISLRVGTVGKRDLVMFSGAQTFCKAFRPKRSEGMVKIGPRWPG